MWEWDYSFSSRQHGAKPLTQAQIKKLQQAYIKSGKITETIRFLEEEEKIKGSDELEDTLRNFL